MPDTKVYAVVLVDSESDQDPEGRPTWLHATLDGARARAIDVATDFLAQRAEGSDEFVSTVAKGLEPDDVVYCEYYNPLDGLAWGESGDWACFVEERAVFG